MPDEILPCVSCGSTSHLVGHGVVAPFISELSDGPIGTRTALLSCTVCGCRYYSHRYSERELDSIYGHYRGERYFEARQRWEPWYRAGLNAAFDPGSPAIRDRREFAERLLASADQESYEVAIDFGGDRGQFFPRQASGRRIVIDVSDAQLMSGVERFDSLDTIGARPDLVMICHVLEHLNDPMETLQEIRQGIRDGGTLYAEVPLDMPVTRPRHSTAKYQSYLTRLSGRRNRFVAADFVTGLARQFRRPVPRFGVVKQSEHINYFTEQSLALLLSRGGFDVVASVAEPAASVEGLRLGRLGLVARPS